MDENAIKQCYKLLAHESETEIRTIDIKNGGKSESYFVHSEQEFLQKCIEFNGKVNIYAGLNERKHLGTTTKDVLSVKTIVADIDALRPGPKLPATEEDIKKCSEAVQQICKDCHHAGFKLPVVAYTGNGYQLWFFIEKIDITNENREDIEQRIQLFHESLQHKYNPLKQCKIDKIGDLPRIVRIIGTENVKGGRVSYFLDGTERVEDDFLKREILSFEVSEETSIATQEEFMNKSPDEIRNILKKPEILPLYYGNTKGFLSRSEAEMSLIIKLIRNNLNKKQCFEIMHSCRLGKWQEAHPQYRESTYKRAVEWVQKIIAEQQQVNNSSDEEDDEIFYLLNVQTFRGLCPFFYDKNGLYWEWNKNLKFWEKTDETNLMNSLEHALNIPGQTVKTGIKNNYLEAIRRVGRLNIPKNISVTSIQFRDKIFDIKNKVVVDASPEWFCCNPIPYEIGSCSDTPVINKLFTEWVGEKNVPLLYEILAYCCIPDYPIHRLFAFTGIGCNGKSRYLALIRHFIGNENCTSSELDLLSENRFETAKLFKKLVCMLGETNFNNLNKTSLLKSLAGQDFIGFEFKNKNPFADLNYAKILIATNQLPTCDDNSAGWFRRWCIIDFPNQFPEGHDILSIIPEQEYSNMAKKVTEILPALLDKGAFSNEGDIAERQKRYELASDPFKSFVMEWCSDDVNSQELYGSLFTAFTTYLKRHNKRIISRKQFSDTLARNGYEWRTTTVFGENGTFVFGLRLQDSWKLL